MRCLLLCVFLLTIPICSRGASSDSVARSAEDALAIWLAHPLEFGVRPKRVKYLTSISTAISGRDKPVNVRVVEYEMPDGTYGKGFVNPVTWSFVGELPYDRLTNLQLVMAYSGWVLLFGSLQNGKATSEFSPTTLDEVKRNLLVKGVEAVSISNKYRIGDSEFFEFRGTRAGHVVKGAGSIEFALILDESDPRTSLPVVYTFLAMVMRGEI